MDAARPRWRRRLVAGLAVVVLGAALLLALVRAGQGHLVYHPDRDDPGPAAEAVDGGTDVTLRTTDGLTLTAWFAPADDGRDAAVLVAPGNGGHRLDRAGLAEHLVDRGFAVLLLEYRGYGGNPGRPDEAGLLLDARAAQRALVTHGFPPDRTVYLGESLGAGVAVALAAEVPPAAVLLRSPFTSLADTAAHHYPLLPVDALLRDRYDVVTPLSGLCVPVTVVHGTADTIVPPAQSTVVARTAPHLVEHVVLAGVGHNDPVMSGPQVADAVARLADHAGL